MGPKKERSVKRVCFEEWQSELQRMGGGVTRCAVSAGASLRLHAGPYGPLRSSRTRLPWAAAARLPKTGSVRPRAGNRATAPTLPVLVLVLVEESRAAARDQARMSGSSPAVGTTKRAMRARLAEAEAPSSCGR